MTDIGRQLLNVPMGDMIRQMAFAIADAQHKLDASSIESAEMMGGLKTIVDDQGKVTFTDSRVYFGAEYTSLRQYLSAPESDEIHNMVENVAKDRAYEFVFDEGASGSPSAGAIALITTNTNVVTPTTATLKIGWKTFLKYYKQAQAKSAAITDPAKKTDKDKVDALIAFVIKENASRLDGDIRVPTRVSMLELGFAPTFYQFVDTIIEVKISISITQTNESSVEIGTKSTGVSFNPFRRKGPKAQISTSQVNASYASKYSYTAEGSSLLRTKLVPIPTPEILERRIEALMEQEAARRAAALPAPTP
jgi:hypothetical protein